LNHKNPLFEPEKKQAVAQGHICTKKISKIVVTLWIHSSRQVGYMFEEI